MSTKKKIDRQSGGHAEAYAHCCPWADGLRLWRTVPADGFGPAEHAAVAECMRRTSSTIEVWRAAIGGDAPSAIRRVLRMKRPPAITASTDLTMTVLLNAALAGSAGAALVLSHLLRQMPLDDVERRRLSTSWLAHNMPRAEADGGGIRRRLGRRAARVSARTEGEVKP
ncbi:hypothetical protein HAP41_0000049215 (plasmid) [Bradyrhizobium barranii subsp. apii]|uniref:Uncharacterized protein n=1 Tax=Bradyrhizobium barranii subsp. apii TaxID=2819348 RepID=A0A8T5VMD2_9BRAD|nr:hypothetical protein [Bradyrhizobium barranii]UPT92436.1 hypothetical protein HAP41_0000049215 [Bradyrhizobium barranii subsp. apii]